MHPWPELAVHPPVTQTQTQTEPDSDPANHKLALLRIQSKTVNACPGAPYLL